MQTPQERKQLVKEKYAEIARQSKAQNQHSCGGAGGCSSVETDFSEDYTRLAGYVPDADLALGCGLPTEYARIREGDTVLDLGSGAGNDCFVARSIVSERGRVIGLDMTDAMIEKARRNAATLGYENVEFVLGEIEQMPLNENSVDVVVSNCVLNLVPDKTKAFAEVYRVLKPGGHFSISDVVLAGDLPAGVREASEMYVGCVSGALPKAEYVCIMETTGFANVVVQKECLIQIPDDVLRQYVTNDELRLYRASDAGVYSITVSGEKPDAKR